MCDLAVAAKTGRPNHSIALPNDFLHAAHVMSAVIHAAHA